MVIEIKRSTAPVVSKGLRIARDDLAARETYLVHGGDATWPMGDGVIATSLGNLVRRLETGSHV